MCWAVHRPQYRGTGPATRRLRTCFISSAARASPPAARVVKYTCALGDRRARSGPHVGSQGMRSEYSCLSTIRGASPATRRSASEVTLLTSGARPISRVRYWIFLLTRTRAVATFCPKASRLTPACVARTSLANRVNSGSIAAVVPRYGTAFGTRRVSARRSPRATRSRGGFEEAAVDADSWLAAPIMLGAVNTTAAVAPAACAGTATDPAAKANPPAA